MKIKRTLDLETLKLLSGAHASSKAGMCVMEAVAFVAGEPHSDHPECASPVIAQFLRTWNDDLDDVGRQRLKPYVLKVVGTRASAEVEDQRGWLCADWMVRVHTVAWLELGGMKDQADALRALVPLTSETTLDAALPPLNEARKRSDAAGAAAWDAARDAAWDAARDAALAASWDAARDASWDAARDAATQKLEPTKLSLQESAFALLDRMIALGGDQCG